MKTPESGKTSDNKLIYIIITGWLVVVAGVLVYFFGYYAQQNKFWKYSNKNAKIITTIEFPEEQSEITPAELYSVLALYQNPEQLIIQNSNAKQQQTLHGNNTFYLGTWNNLGEFKSLLPDSIVSFNNAKKTLKWKHNDGFYNLPLSTEQTSLTYAIAAKIRLESNVQSHLFILFDEANPIQFLEQLCDEENIKHLTETLNLTETNRSFIALYKVPQLNSKETKIELLEGHILNH